ncbi:hypothetical protein F2Q68_00016707 [Brassica cretica]|uniref:Uncharacterized protein n=1 Tax=Brassica cretica TaxID=69181 RepID=A0A8S9HBD9_BRACR|nr:hypothetical protein F2Q68_00016707 [Brassica cretica]
MAKSKSKKKGKLNNQPSSPHIDIGDPSSGVERTMRRRAGPSSVVERTTGRRAGPSSGVERTRRQAQF